MSLERYFARAHDEARRLLREMPWLMSQGAPLPWDAVPKWLVSVGGYSRPRFLIPAATAHDAAHETAADCQVKPLPTIYIMRVLPGGLRRILDRAMVDTDGRPTLAAGEGAEARRLLEMVDWDRVPQTLWPDVFDTLRMAAAAKAIGWATWETTLVGQLEEERWLAGAAERSAA